MASCGTLHGKHPTVADTASWILGVQQMRAVALYTTGCACSYQRSVCKSLCHGPGIVMCCFGPGRPVWLPLCGWCWWLNVGHVRCEYAIDDACYRLIEEDADNCRELTNEEEMLVACSPQPRASLASSVNTQQQLNPVAAVPRELHGGFPPPLLRDVIGMKTL